jgi:DNA-binding HxlR family transcriptional regulator
MSPSVLYQRLDELQDARLIQQASNQHYELTDIGRALGTALRPLDEWSRRWAEQMAR